VALVIVFAVLMKSIGRVGARFGVPLRGRMVDPKNDPSKMIGSGIKSATMMLTIVGVVAVLKLGTI
jgi:hypothetical protein